MKVTSNDVEVKPEFVPVELTILIENEVDLSWLWACVNCGHGRVVEATRNYPQLQAKALKAINFQQDSLFNAIDNIAEAKGIKGKYDAR